MLIIVCFLMVSTVVTIWTNKTTLILLQSWYIISIIRLDVKKLWILKLLHQTFRLWGSENGCNFHLKNIIRILTEKKLAIIFRENLGSEKGIRTYIFPPKKVWKPTQKLAMTMTSKASQIMFYTSCWNGS